MCFAPQRRALFGQLVNIWTSKSGAYARCFARFHFQACFAPHRRALFRHRNFQKPSEAEVFCTFLLQNVPRATTASTFSTSELPNVVRIPGVLYIFTWKCASHHNNSVHFFNISTSKSRPSMVCFDICYFQMCFAPQRRAFLQHLNFQKSPEHGVFCTFSLPNVLRATTACLFFPLKLRQYVQMKSTSRKKLGMEKLRREKIRDGEDQRGRKSEERRCRCARK